MEFVATIRTSGGSLVITVPKEVAEQMKLKPASKVSVKLTRGIDIRDLRGIAKGYVSVEGLKKLRSRKDYK